MGTLVLVILLAILVPIPYLTARHHWFPEWQDTTWSVGLLIAVVFAPWFVAFEVVTAPGGLVPLAMAVLFAAYAFGRWQRWHAWRRFKDESRD